MNPEVHNKAYSNLCDKVGNIMELCYAGFFLISSMAGEYICELKGPSFTFNIFIIIGGLLTCFYLFFDCGLNCYKDHRDFKDKMQRINSKIIKIN